MIKICEYCGREYEACPTCEGAKYFAWRKRYCCINCFENYICEGGKYMRVEYKGKRYTIKKYDLKNGEYISSNDLIIKERDITAFILPFDEFKKVKEFKVVKTRKQLEKIVDDKEEE